MPKQTTGTIPQLKRKRESGKRKDRAYVWLDGKRHYLGEFGSKASEQAYSDLISVWLANGRKLPEVPELRESLTVADLSAMFWKFCKGYYVKHGKPTAEQACIKGALKPLLELFGHVSVNEFSAPMLVSVQEKMVASGNSRSYINKSISRIKRCFKWGVKNGHVDGATAFALTTVDGLKFGRTKAKETKGVKPVPQADIDKTLLECKPVLVAMVNFQLLTGCRPGEVCSMRPCDLDRTNPECWIYRPPSHKTEHQNKCREILINRKAQELIGAWLKRRYVFLTPRFKVFTERNYRDLIQAACIRADVNRWSPNQLRHNAATRMNSEFGLQVTKTLLGHSRVETTQIYAEADKAKAVESIRGFSG